MNFLLNSPAFRDGGAMPRKYTREGQNVAPPLEWENAPPETRSYVLVVDDPDAPSGTFHHMALYNIPGERHELPEGMAEGAFGTNDFGRRHWDGPEPPRGHGRHHYHFRLAALDVPSLDLPDNATVPEIWREALRHSLGQAELVATYERR